MADGFVEPYFVEGLGLKVVLDIFEDIDTVVVALAVLELD